MSGTTEAALDLQHVADELGVHYQTAYRWVRTGKLPARLVNGKYQVRLDDIERFRTSRVVERPPAPPSPERLHRHADTMHTALVNGDEADARQIARSLVGEGTSVIDLIQTVLVPPLRRIGQSWHDGEISIWVEHRASAIVERLLGEIATNPRGRRKGSVLVAAVAGDRHSLPTAMAALTLRDANWDVHHLGADMPPEELFSFCDAHDVDVAVISSTNSEAAELAAETAAALTERGTPAILGGPGSTLESLLERCEAARS